MAYESKAEIMKNVKKPYTKAQKIANNTYEITFEDGSIGIRLHQVTIITILPDGRRIFDSEGHRQQTTKERMNRFSGIPVYIHQVKGKWYCNGVIDYYDGIVFDKEGRLVSGDSPPEEVKNTLVKPKSALEQAKSFLDSYDF